MNMRSLFRTAQLIIGAILCTESSAQELKELKIHMDSLSIPVQLEAVEAIKKGDQYKVVIDGINLNLYKVEVNGRDTSSAKPISFPSFGAFNVDAITALVGGVGELATKASLITMVTGVKARYVYKQAETPEGLSEIRMSSRVMGLGLERMTAADWAADYVKDSLNTLSARIGTEANALLQTKNEIDDMQHDVNMRILALKHMSAKKAQTMDYSKALKDVEELRKRLRKQQAVVISLQKQHAQFVSEDDVEPIIEANKDLEKLSAKIKDGETALIKSITEALGSIDAAKTMAMLETLQILESNASHTYSSLPFQYKGGDAEVTVNITPLKPEYNLQTYKLSYSFPIKDPTYWGVSAAFYGAGLYNEAYSVVSSTTITGQDTTSTYNLVEERVTKNEIGAAALFTVGRKLKDNGCFGGQLVIGPGITITETVRPRLLLGGGLSFGRNHMVQVNGGVITGFVDRRSSAYPNEGPYGGEPGEPTVVRLEGSWFVSIGYLFKL